MSKRENRRSDVRRKLLDQGWTPLGRSGLLRGRVVWAPSNGVGDSSVSKYTGGGVHHRALFTIEFATDVPPSVIVATCEAAAKGARRFA